MTKKALVLIITFFSILAREAERKEELARVGVLKFNDANVSNRLEYMPVSLQEAIDNSLQKRFLYVRQDPKILNQTVEKKAKNTPILSREQVQAISSETKTDVLVYGHFLHDDQNNEVTIYPHIYVTSQNRIIPIDPVKNPIDDSLFQAVDTVAQQIVLSMLQLAQESEKTEAKTEVPQEREKAKITTQSVTQEKTRQWFYLFHLASLGLWGEITKYTGPSAGLKMGLQRLLLQNWLVTGRWEFYNFTLSRAFEPDKNNFSMHFFSIGPTYLYPLPKNFALTLNLLAGSSISYFQNSPLKYNSFFGEISLSLRYSVKNWLLFEVELESLAVLSKPKTLWASGLSLGTVILFL